MKRSVRLSLVLVSLMSFSSVMYGSNDKHHEVMNNNRMEVRHDMHCMDEMKHGHHDKHCMCECHKMDKQGKVQMGNRMNDGKQMGNNQMQNKGQNGKNMNNGGRR